MRWGSRIAVCIPSLKGRGKGWVMRRAGLDAPSDAIATNDRQGLWSAQTRAPTPAPSLSGRGVTWRYALLALAAATALPAHAQSNADLEAKLAQLSQRAERLKDLDAIENLQAAYGYYFDKALWGEVADLFTAAGSFEYGQRGVYIGKAHIRRALLLLGPEGQAKGWLNEHMQLQPIITVAPDGRSAKARWRGMVQIARPNQNGQWGEGTYENDYVKEGGVWKIAKLHFYVTGFTDYDLGWTKSAIPAEGPSAVIPPDRPPTEIYRAYPGVYIPPFDYVHPVTGKPIPVTPPADSVLGRK
jgi:hypothetical protein